MRTTQTLIDQVRILSNIPNNQEKFTNQQILDIANNELVGYILPKLMNVREEFYVTEHSYDVIGSNRYRIPSRAVANKLRDVQLQSDSEIYNCARISREDVNIVEGRGAVESPYGFYLQGPFFIFFPALLGVTKILAPFFLRPNSLVELSAAAQINAIDRETNSISVASLPSTILTGGTVDLVKRNGQYDSMAYDIVVESISGMTVTLSEELPEDLQVGDYLCLAETAPVVQIPEEWYPLFTDRIICRIMQSQGDTEAFKIAQLKMEELELTAQDLVTPRVEGESEVLMSPHWNNRIGF